MPVFQLTDDLLFPPPRLAREDGLLAVGGDLTPERLILAYSQGIFPWYAAGEPILWWSPAPRLILLPGEFHCSRRLSRQLRQGLFEVTMDTAFAQVVEGCANAGGRRKSGTWILPEMAEAYGVLHELGFAHSVECWQNGELAGGLYGVALGGVFFGESMFSRAANSSKAALAALCGQLVRWRFTCLDCQMHTPHLERLGAREIDREAFEELLDAGLARPTRRSRWQFDAAPPGRTPGRERA